MTSPLPSPKPRAFSKWLDTGATPFAAVDTLGRVQYHNEAFIPFLQDTHPDILSSDLLPPAEAWNGTPCYRRIAPNHHAIESNKPIHDCITFLPLQDHSQSIFGCLIALGHLESIPFKTLGNDSSFPLSHATSDVLQDVILEFRKKWGELTQLDILVGQSPQIRRTLQQVHLAIATQTPVLIRGFDLNACHDLAKGIWLQRFKRSQISSAGFQFMPLCARTLDGEMLRSVLELALPLQLRGEYLETCLLIEDVADMSETTSRILAEWLSQHRPPQIFGTQILSQDRLSSQPKSEWIDHYLAILTIDIPALRDRPEDIPAIATRILNHATTPGKSTLYAFSSSALEMLLAYPWNGDFSELRTLIRQINLPSHKFVVDVTDLPLAIRSYIGGKATATPGTTSISLDETLLELEKNLIEKVLQEARGNRALAARRLGVSRARLLRRLAQLQITSHDNEPSPEMDSTVDSTNSRHTSPSLIPHTATAELTADSSDKDNAAKDNTAADEISAIDFVPVDDEPIP